MGAFATIITSGRCRLAWRANCPPYRSSLTSRETKRELVDPFATGNRIEPDRLARLCMQAAPGPERYASQYEWTTSWPRRDQLPAELHLKGVTAVVVDQYPQSVRAAHAGLSPSAA